MGDAGEGLIDADAKIQERMEELSGAAHSRVDPRVKNPEQVREIESLRLARKEMSRQLENTTHEARRAQIDQRAGRDRPPHRRDAGRARRVGFTG